MCQKRKRLCSGPQWSNLLRQHINYRAGLGCHLLQTGQIPIERSGYKKHLWFVSFLWNVTHTEWEEMVWIIINSGSVQHRGLSPHQWVQKSRSLVMACTHTHTCTHRHTHRHTHKTNIKKRVCKIWKSRKILLYLTKRRWLILLNSKQH